LYFFLGPSILLSSLCSDTVSPLRLFLNGGKAWKPSLILSVVCLTTSPQSLPKRVRHRVRSSASSSNLQYSQAHPVSADVFFLVFPSLLPYFCLSFSNVFHKAVPTQDVTNPFSLPSFNVCMIFHSSSTLCNTSSFLTRSVQLIFQPSPAPYFKTFQVFLVDFPKCSSFSTTQTCAPNVALYSFLPLV